VKSRQPTNREEHQGYDAHDHHGHNGGHLCKLLLVMKHMDQAKYKDTNHVKTQRYQKHEEVPIVAPSNTIVDPGTVVIKDLNTIVTNTAMTAPWRPVKLTSNAPLHSDYRDPVYLNISVKRSSEIIISVLIRTGSRDHTRIHKGCHGKIDQDEQCYDSLEDWNCVPLLFQNVPLNTRKIEEKCCGSQKQHPGEGCRQELGL